MGLSKTAKYYRDNPKAKAKKAEYDKEYNKKTVGDRVKRNAARKAMEEKHGKAALKGKDVDHKTPLKDGGSNSKRNLRITSRKHNRGRSNWPQSKRIDIQNIFAK